MTLQYMVLHELRKAYTDAIDGRGVTFGTVMGLGRLY